ncbi:MAG: hypothetical protein MUE60_07860 [Candidatus Eisenbacteria bacterium]|nr:hypothetical protein [Candidatus Eisenbacteria bacterium]
MLDDRTASGPRKERRQLGPAPVAEATAPECIQHVLIGALPGFQDHGFQLILGHELLEHIAGQHDRVGDAHLDARNADVFLRQELVHEGKTPALPSQ